MTRTTQANRLGLPSSEECKAGRFAYFVRVTRLVSDGASPYRLAQPAQ